MKKEWDSDMDNPDEKNFIINMDTYFKRTRIEGHVSYGIAFKTDKSFPVKDGINIEIFDASFTDTVLVVAQEINYHEFEDARVKVLKEVKNILNK